MSGFSPLMNPVTSRSLFGHALMLSDGLSYLTFIVITLMLSLLSFPEHPAIKKTIIATGKHSCFFILLMY
jgi:hypothetical protein